MIACTSKLGARHAVQSTSGQQHTHAHQARTTISANRRLGPKRTEKRSLQVLGSKQMSFESSFETQKRLNMDTFLFSSTLAVSVFEKKKKQF